MCVFGSTDEPKPDAPPSDTETTSEAESKAWKLKFKQLPKRGTKMQKKQKKNMYKEEF